MKKHLSLLLALALMMSLFAAFATTGTAEGEKTELNFWYWDINMDECYAEMFEAFTAENPDITVNLTRIPWSDYWTKLQTALPSGTGPDIFWLNHPNAVTYLPTGYVKNLQSYVDDGTLIMSQFADSLKDPFKYDDDLYAIPIFFDTIAIAYNKEMLAEAGYPDGPPADWTWDDLREIAIALTTDDVYGFAVNGDQQSHVSDFILQNGGSMYSEDGLTCTIADDNSVEAIQFMLDLMYVDKVSPTQADQKELVAIDMLQNDMLAMMPFGLWNIATVYEAMGDNLGFAEMPRNEQQGTVVHNLGYVMSTSCSNTEAGIKVMEYLASQDHGDRIATVFAPAYEESQSLWFETFPDLNLNVFTDALSYSKGLMIPSKNAGTVYSLMTDELDKLFLKNYDSIDLKADLEDIAAAVNAEIAK